MPTGGNCPTASFEVFGDVHTIDVHCTLLDEHYTMIAGIALLAWAFLGLIVVLRA